MIRFLYGAGSERTKKALLDAISADIRAGHSAVLLVPEQETVVTERRMLRSLSPAAQLSFEVLNFTRLANRTFRAVGGLSYRYATQGTCALLMWKTLRALAPALLQYGTHAATDARLCDHMLSAVAQFKAYCVSPEALTDAAALLPEGEPLKAKLTDLGLVLASYQNELYSRFDDAADDITRAASLIAEHRELFQNTHVYIDSFTDFTAQEMALIKVLIEAAPSVTVTFPLTSPADEGIHLTSALRTHRRILRLASELSKRVFFDDAPEKKPCSALEYIRRDLFDMNAEPAPLSLAESGEVTLTCCSSPYAEAEYAATVIARLVREGCRYKDITVIVRDLASYTGIIDAALEKEGIPFYFAEKTDITLRPLIKLILFALRIKQYNWQKEDVVGYLKTGLCGIGADDINFFEEYAEVWRLCGARAFAAPFTMNADGYAEESSARGKRILEGANRARALLVPPLLTLFEALDGADNAAAMSAAIYDFLLSLDVPAALKQRAADALAAGERREAEELSRLWGVLVDAFDELSTTLGEESLDIAGLCDALRLVFERTDIGAIPTSADEVTVGSAATLRADHTRFAIVLSLNEGVFPQTVSGKGLLSDAEKARLADLGIELSADSASVASDELFYVYRAFSLPQERLFLSYATAGVDGRSALPSIAVGRIKTLFPALKPLSFDAMPATDKIFSLGGGIEHLRELDAAEREALLSLLRESEETAHKCDTLLTPVTETAAAVSPTLAERIFDSSAFNPTGLEAFVSCKFAYYCKKVLRLREEPSDALDSSAVGVFIHYVLENAFRAVKDAKKPYADYTEDEIGELVKKSVSDYRTHLIEAGGWLTPRAEALLTRLSALARIVIGSLFAEFADSLFSPAFFELNLTAKGERAAIALSNGTEIPLSGKADRVDLYKAEDGTVYLRVADYKTGKKSFRREDIPKGYCLQMPLYLYALCRGRHPRLAAELGLDPNTVFRPAGVTYLSTAVGNENTSARVDEGEALRSAAARLKREGLLPADEELLHAISLSGSEHILGTNRTRSKKTLSPAEFEVLFDELSDTVGRISGEMRSGCANVDPMENDGKTPCKFCAFGAVCRAAVKDNS